MGGDWNGAAHGAGTATSSFLSGFFLFFKPPMTRRAGGNGLVTVRKHTEGTCNGLRGSARGESSGCLGRAPQVVSGELCRQQVVEISHSCTMVMDGLELPLPKGGDVPRSQAQPRSLRHQKPHRNPHQKPHQDPIRIPSGTHRDPTRTPIRIPHQGPQSPRPEIGRAHV